ncbi:MAG: TetR family transcriptional regulator [Chloroflexi bacterium]|jgi:AcrR family transcriptional regulator|nr:TetR family transcriptional regulator [Chloroflexota bacterium]
MTLLTPAQRRERNRQEMIDGILQVSRDIMRDKGAAALNLNEVARRVGVKTPSLYSYFPNKMAIYDAVFRKGMEMFAEAITIPEGISGWDCFQYVFEAYMSFAVENPELYQILFERPVPGFVPSEESMAFSIASLNRGREEMAEIIAEIGIDPGVPIEQAMDLTIALSHGITAQHMANEPHLPVGEGRYGSLIPQAVALFKSAWGRNLSDNEVDGAN